MKNLADLPVDLLDELVTRGGLCLREHRLLKEILPDLPPNLHAAQRTIAKVWRPWQATRDLFALLREGRGAVEHVKRLLAAGANVNARQRGIDPAYRHRVFYDAPLNLAVSTHSWGVVETLLAAGADPTSRSGYWRDTVLHLLAYGDETEKVQFLVEAGADVHATNRLGDTALMIAAWCDEDENWRNEFYDDGMMVQCLKRLVWPK